MNETVREGRAWQLAGGLAVLGGVAILVSTVAIGGLTLVTTATMAAGLAGAFILMAGLTAFLTGRILQAVVLGFTAREALLWRVLGWVSCGSGALTILLASSAGWAPTLDHLAMGLGGAFTLLGGIVCLLAGRILQHAATRERASAAAAD